MSYEGNQAARMWPARSPKWPATQSFPRVQERKQAAKPFIIETKEIINEIDNPRPLKTIDPLSATVLI